VSAAAVPADGPVQIAGVQLPEGGRAATAVAVWWD